MVQRFFQFGHPVLLLSLCSFESLFRHVKVISILAISPLPAQLSVKKPRFEMARDDSNVRSANACSRLAFQA